MRHPVGGNILIPLDLLPPNHYYRFIYEISSNHIYYGPLIRAIWNISLKILRKFEIPRSRKMILKKLEWEYKISAKKFSKKYAAETFLG